ncbi:hypothetical protein [Streptomyces graminofaciens]|uniref:hypothetical protein n=1 Tax=Streptomyces graminofaciens TaxID=68212 RepID=UPI002572ADD8|nr:hypothetical protein [Streptomyces graminofaciens]
MEAQTVRRAFHDGRLADAERAEPRTIVATARGRGGAGRWCGSGIARPGRTGCRTQSCS